MVLSAKEHMQTLTGKMLCLLEQWDGCLLYPELQSVACAVAYTMFKSPPPKGEFHITFGPDDGVLTIRVKEGGE